MLVHLLNSEQTASMAFNKFMHPRNRYKDNKPNFDELAKKYPEFARHVIRNQAGKATLDFHDSESLRSLTCTLLKEDFGLEVELPLDRLIPTLSLRLNYIHWIEDLLASTGHGKETVWGIDTGEKSSSTLFISSVNNRTLH